MPNELGDTIQGHGGQAFSWVDNTGGVAWSALANYNFNLLPNAPDNWQASISGSFLLSTPIDVAGAQTLTVIANVISAHDFPIYDVGFALLVQGSQVQKVLFALRPDGITQRGDVGSPQQNSFAPPGAGVTVTPVKNGAANVVLGGVSYGPATGSFDGGLSTLVTAVCAPGAGTYQLLFGIFATNGEPNVAAPAALIVQFVNVS
jgi:hypothetical protein